VLGSDGKGIGRGVKVGRRGRVSDADVEEVGVGKGVREEDEEIRTKGREVEMLDWDTPPQR